MLSAILVCVTLSLCDKLSALRHYKIPLFPSRHQFGMRHANTPNTLHYRSLGLNLECVMSRVGKVAPCVGMPDIDKCVIFLVNASS